MLFLKVISAELRSLLKEFTSESGTSWNAGIKQFIPRFVCVTIPSLTLGKIKNGYKPLNEGVKCHFLLCKSL